MSSPSSGTSSEGGFTDTYVGILRLLFDGNQAAAWTSLLAGHHHDRVTARGWALPVALLVFATSGCGSNGPERPQASDDPDRQVASDDHGRLLGLWERGDQIPPSSEFRLREGESHCDMDSALLMDMRWPLDGGNTENADLSFVRDLEGVFAKNTVESFDADAELPDDAIPTGYDNGDGVELWLANDLSKVYAVDSDTVEAWPALPGGSVCA